MTGIYPTWWTSFIDVTDQIYFFDWLYTPNMIWVELKEIDWDTVPGILTLRPQDIDLVGNVLCEFDTLDGEDPMLPACMGDEGDAGADSNDPPVGLRGVTAE